MIVKVKAVRMVNSMHSGGDYYRLKIQLVGTKRNPLATKSRYDVLKEYVVWRETVPT